MEQFEQILIKHNCTTRNGIPKTTIEEIENVINFKLQSDYRTFLQYYSGFEEQIGTEFLRLWDIDELLEMNKEYAIIDNLTNTLGIGGNGGGEFIAIEWIDEENVRIVLSPFIDLNQRNHIEIGTSFTDFLTRLDGGKSWFGEKSNTELE